MKNKLVRFILSISIILIIAVAFLMGRFTAHFDDNLCYSNLLKQITLKLKHSNTKEIYLLQEKLQTLPLHGYESDCDEIHNAFLKNNFYSLVS